MKNLLVVSVSAFLFFSCSEGANDQEMSDYSAEVCACAAAATNQAEWDECNNQRKDFYSKFDLDADDADASKTNDIMYDCLSANETFE
ncbi:MAG: hypothetical protein QNK23_10530 [Crocinitomicaceae bacterium]|nr:hypothetical protein [Crocinitomicaceae bacterium]